MFAGYASGCASSGYTLRSRKGPGKRIVHGTTGVRCQPSDILLGFIIRAMGPFFKRDRSVGHAERSRWHASAKYSYSSPVTRLCSCGATNRSHDNCGDFDKLVVPYVTVRCFLLSSHQSLCRLCAAVKMLRENSSAPRKTAACTEYVEEADHSEVAG
jgi:hypothetical protein